jgi:hypothetical protein
MLIVEIFYGIFWVSMLSIIWFYTDWLVHYSHLFGIAEKTRLSFQEFLLKEPQSFFSDFLYAKSLKTNNRFKKFVLKLCSCPFCLLVWLSVCPGLVCGNLIVVAPIYVSSLFITLQIKRLL